MNAESADPRHKENTSSVLAIFLFTTGLLCAVVSGAAWLADIDAPELIRQALQRAQGTVSDETMFWLRSLRPLRTLTLTGVALLLSAVIAHFARRPLQARFARAPEPAAAVRERPWILAACIALLVATQFHSTLRSGYFRYDDFELLAVAGDDLSWNVLWSLHGDHVLPLTRLLAWSALHLFGTAPWIYNLFVLVCMGGLLFSACRVLAALGASRAAQAVFLVLVVFWSPWAELMSGYYILSSYLLITWMSLVAFHSHLSWRRTHRTGPVAVLLLCLLLAPLVDISGAYVPAAGAVFVALGIFRENQKASLHDRLVAHRWPIAAVVSATVISAAWLFHVYAHVHPNTFLGMAAGEGRSLTRTLLDLLYAFDAGLLLSMVVPFVYARMPLILLGVLGVGVAIAGFWFMRSVTLKADRGRRSSVLAIALVLAGVCLMVVLGRPSEQTVVVRWAAKHIGPAYVWLCLLLAFGWDTLWTHSRSRARLTECTVIALVVFSMTQTAFGMLGMAVEFPPFGYPAEIRDAQRRRTAVTELGRDIASKLVDNTGAPLTAPTLDGRYIERAYPSLFSYNLSHYLSFFGAVAPRLNLVRNPVMQRWHTGAVRTVPVLRDTVSPLFLERLKTDETLRGFYLAEVSLNFEPSVPSVTTSMMAHPPSGPAELASDGGLEIPIRDSAWDPETAPVLRLWIERKAGDNRPVNLTVVFFSELTGADWHGRLDYPGTVTGALQVDLRQIYAFSLSRQVSRLRIVLAAPGHYRLHAAEIIP